MPNWDVTRQRSAGDCLASAEAAALARDQLGHLFLDVARKAKVGLRDLSAICGLHHATIRAMIQRAIGPGLPDGFVQPELPIYAELAVGAVPVVGQSRGNRVQPTPPIPAPPATLVMSL